MTLVDAAYRSLRERGHAGWGGTKFKSRLKGWGRELDSARRRGLLPSPPALALELGCGNGAVSALLARRGYAVTGVDVSANAVEWARDDFRRRKLHGEFLVCDVTSGLRRFGDASFDLIVDGNCLHCVCTVDARAQALLDVRSLLRRDGRFVVSSMCGEPRSLEESDVFDAERRLLMRDGLPYRFLATIDGLTNEIDAAGFDVESVRVQSNPWWDHSWLIVKRRN